MGDLCLIDGSLYDREVGDASLNDREVGDVSLNDREVGDVSLYLLGDPSLSARCLYRPMPEFLASSEVICISFLISSILWKIL